MKGNTYITHCRKYCTIQLGSPAKIIIKCWKVVGHAGVPASSAHFFQAQARPPASKAGKFCGDTKHYYISYTCKLLAAEQYHLTSIALGISMLTMTLWKKLMKPKQRTCAVPFMALCNSRHINCTDASSRLMSKYSQIQQNLSLYVYYMKKFL